MIASRHNPNPAAIQILIQAGADVNARGNNGFTPLMLAALGNINPGVLEALLAAGADAKAVSLDGKSAYDYATQNGRIAGTDVCARLKEAAGEVAPRALLPKDLKPSLAPAYKP